MLTPAILLENSRFSILYYAPKINITAGAKIPYQNGRFFYEITTLKNFYCLCSIFNNVFPHIP